MKCHGRFLSVGVAMIILARFFFVCSRCYAFLVTVLSVCRHCYAILVTVLFVSGGAMIFLSRFLTSCIKIMLLWNTQVKKNAGPI